MRMLDQFYLFPPTFVRPAAEISPLLRNLLSLAGSKFSGSLSADDFRDKDGKPMNSLMADGAASILGLAALAVRQTGAIVALLDRGFADQGLTLARSLYETTVNLKTIASSASFVAAQEFVDFQACTNYRIRRWFIEDPNHKAVAAAIAADKTTSQLIDDEYHSFKATYPTKPEASWHVSSVVDRAKASGLNLRAHYQWLCAYTHGNVQAVRSLFVHEGGGRYTSMTPPQFHSILPFFSLFCLTAALETTFNSFGWDIGEIEEYILWVADPETSLDSSSHPPAAPS